MSGNSILQYSTEFAVLTLLLYVLEVLYHEITYYSFPLVQKVVCSTVQKVVCSTGILLYFKRFQVVLSHWRRHGGGGGGQRGRLPPNNFGEGVAPLQRVFGCTRRLGIQSCCLYTARGCGRCRYRCAILCKLVVMQRVQSCTVPSQLSIGVENC